MAISIEYLDLEYQENRDPWCIETLYTASMELGKWIRECRARAGINQSELGERLGVTKGNVSAWENDRHQPSYAQLVSIWEQTGKHVTPPWGEPSAGVWPFPNIDQERFATLPERLKGRIEERVLLMIEEYEETQLKRSANGS